MYILLASLPGKIKTLLTDRLTVDRANGLDNITAGPVALAATALSVADWTPARAGYLDKKISEISTKSKSLIYSATASGTFTPSAEMSLIYVTIQAAGASGGHGNSSINSGGGGGAGECLVRIPYNVTAGVGITFSCPAGSTGSTSNNAVGTAGGDATFGIFTAKGGLAGSLYNNGGAGGGAYGGAEQTTMGNHGNSCTAAFCIVGGAGGGTRGVSIYGGTSPGGRYGGTGYMGSYYTGGGGASYLANGGNGVNTAATDATQPGYGAGGGGGSQSGYRAGQGGNACIIIEWIGADA